MTPASDRPRMLGPLPETTTSATVLGVVDLVADMGTHSDCHLLRVELCPWMGERGESSPETLVLWKRLLPNEAERLMAALRIGVCVRVQVRDCTSIPGLERAPVAGERLLVDVVDEGPIDHERVRPREPVTDVVFGDLFWEGGEYRGTAELAGARIPVIVEGDRVVVLEASRLHRVLRLRWAALLDEVAAKVALFTADWCDEEWTAAQVARVIEIDSVDHTGQTARLNFDSDAIFEDHGVVATVDATGRLIAVDLV